MALVEITQAIHKAQPLSLRLYAVDGATVFVRKPDGSQEPVYATSAGGTPVTQPLTSQNGRIEGWVEEGRHLDLVVSKPGEIVGYTQRIVSGGGPIGPAGAKGDKGDPGTMTVGAYGAVTRAAGTNYQPSLTRAVLVVASLYLYCDPLAEGRWDVKCADVAPPAMVVGQPFLRNGNNASFINAWFPVSFMVPAGYYYRFDSVAVAGTPAFSIARVVESVL